MNHVSRPKYESRGGTVPRRYKPFLYFPKSTERHRLLVRGNTKGSPFRYECKIRNSYTPTRGKYAPTAKVLYFSILRICTSTVDDGSGVSHIVLSPVRQMLTMFAISNGIYNPFLNPVSILQHRTLHGHQQEGLLLDQKGTTKLPADYYHTTSAALISI
jgi:hypothetical protein